MEETMDIQRGDLIYIYPSGPESGRIPAEVTGISGNGPEVILEVRYTQPDGSTVNESVPLGKCAPIPLTEDILVMNGFSDEYNRYGENIYDACIETDGGDVVHISVTAYTGGEFDAEVSIISESCCTITVENRKLYVHDIQHMLRLCCVKLKIKVYDREILRGHM